MLKLSDIELKGKPYDFTGGNLYIILPNKGSEAGHAGYEKFIRNRNYEKIEVREARDFPFYIDLIQTSGRIALYDYPTTLLATMEVIRYIFEEGTISEKQREIMERREIVNFERTLSQLLESAEASNFKDNISIIYLDQIISNLHDKYREF